MDRARPEQTSSPAAPRSAATARRAAALLLLAVALAAVARRFPLPVSRFRVEGASMEPNYRHGDRVLVNRLAYWLRPPAPGDAVVLRDPERPGHILLKRIAAAPSGTLGADGYHLLGDNREASRDSRAFGPVPRAAFLGKAWLTYAHGGVPPAGGAPP